MDYNPYISMDEKPTWNSTWQVRIMLVRILKKKFKTTIEGRMGECVAGPGEIHANLLYIMIIKIIKNKK
jgi:hypothetical protein